MLESRGMRTVSIMDLFKKKPERIHKYSTDKMFRSWMQSFDSVPDRIGLLMSTVVQDLCELRELDARLIAERNEKPGDPPGLYSMLLQELGLALKDLEGMLRPIHEELQEGHRSHEPKRWAADFGFNRYLYKASKVTMHPMSSIAELTQDHHVFGHVRKRHRIKNYTTEILRVNTEMQYWIGAIDLPESNWPLSSSPGESPEVPSETTRSIDNVPSSAQDELPEYSLATSGTHDIETTVASSSRNDGSTSIQTSESKAEASTPREKIKGLTGKASPSLGDEQVSLPPLILQQPPWE